MRAAARRPGGVRVTWVAAAAWVLAGAATAPSAVRAQAWLPDKGTFAYTIGYGDLFNKKHYLPSGDEVDVGHTRVKSLAFSVTYAWTDRVALSAGIPVVSSEFHGEHPHAGTKIDDSRYHTTITDFTAELRYQALAAPLALAPYLSLSVPTHSYETLGHAAPGTGLMRYGVGLFAGSSLDPWIPRTYLHGRFGYTYLEPVAEVAHARSNVDLELGYFVTQRFAVRALGSWQEAHGGIDVPVPVTHPLYPYHDQLAAESFLNVGAGASVALTERADVYAAYLTSVRGRNGHKLEDGFSFGVSCRTASRDGNGDKRRLR
jgi:hypothetical protein